jgi:hypothetical protein
MWSARRLAEMLKSRGEKPLQRVEVVRIGSSASIGD